MHSINPLSHRGSVDLHVIIHFSFLDFFSNLGENFTVSPSEKGPPFSLELIWWQRERKSERERETVILSNLFYGTG
jgi:hypothetical protein